MFITEKYMFLLGDKKTHIFLVSNKKKYFY